MGKMEYLDALKRSMMGLPPETQAKTLAYYEQRFVDGVAAGRNEEEVGQELDPPHKIAQTLRASAHLGALSERKQPVNVFRMLFSAVGLAIFNLFMLVPAAVLGALLLAVYVCGITFYGSGIVVAASALAGTNEFVFHEPVRHIVINNRSVNTSSGRATINIGSRGIEVLTDGQDQKDTQASHNSDDGKSAFIKTDPRDGTIRVVTDMDAGSRPKQMAAGAGLVVGGIALLLIALVVTRYTLLGLKRYLQMNLSLLKGS